MTVCWTSDIDSTPGSAEEAGIAACTKAHSYHSVNRFITMLDEIFHLRVQIVVGHFSASYQ